MKVFPEPNQNAQNQQQPQYTQVPQQQSQYQQYPQSQIQNSIIIPQQQYAAIPQQQNQQPQYSQPQYTQPQYPQPQYQQQQQQQQQYQQQYPSQQQQQYQQQNPQQPFIGPTPINPTAGPVPPIIQVEFTEIQHPVNLTALAMAHFDIPDQVFFEHFYERLRPCWSGPYGDRSIFNVPGIGTLTYGYRFERHCRYTFTYNPEKFRRKLKYSDLRGCCNTHWFGGPDYQMDNGLLEIEYYGRCGIVIAAGIPIIKFFTAQPNCCDALYGHCGTGYPKVALHFLLEQNKEPLVLIPDVSPCPETTMSCCPELVICGLCKSSRQFTVEGLTKGVCNIDNTRTCTDACANACLCQGDCGCPNVDYPHFQVHFQDVLPVDKLAILLGLVHYNMIKKWYVMTVIQRRIVGLA